MNRPIHRFTVIAALAALLAVAACEGCATTSDTLRSVSAGLVFAEGAAGIGAREASARGSAVGCFAASAFRDAAAVTSDVLDDLGEDARIDAYPAVRVDVSACLPLLDGPLPFVEGDVAALIDAAAEDVIPALRRFADRIVQGATRPSCEQRAMISGALVVFERATPAVARQFTSDGGPDGIVVIPATLIDYTDCDEGAPAAAPTPPGE